MNRDCKADLDLAISRDFEIGFIVFSLLARGQLLCQYADINFMDDTGKSINTQAPHD